MITTEMELLLLVSLLVFLPTCLGSNQTQIDVSEWAKIPSGFKRFGDVILPEDFFNSTSSRNAVPNRSQLWPNGRIPFVIHDSLTFVENNIYQAMEEFHSKTCVRFVPRTNEPNYIAIANGQGCYSLIGCQYQGMQPLSLGMGCTDHGTIVHELNHAIGFFHEHQRSDRDDYIEIQWDNTDQGCRLSYIQAPSFKKRPIYRLPLSAMNSQFEKLEPWQNWLINEFDVNSIMMYGGLAFSKDGVNPTMVHKGGQDLIEVYQKPGLDYSDAQRVNILYGC